ncbi:hypothetical protein JZ751_019943 [Albula glossodonta]|uniref:N-acylglucosamine 2-epimerase n=1 Tax=Albula glossodonta TaxID=121402 RepID=A0A8T2MYL9_9TELE|nr:hypothetical protein JZ751_019943 [Albula glossodonta]
MTAAKLVQFRDRIRTELDRAVDFWLKYSHDKDHGGFFTCIGKDGKVYDDLKYVWLQGRQVWMYSRLYRTMERFHRPEILQAAISGGEFLQKFAWVPSAGSSGKCAFCLTRDGRAVKRDGTAILENVSKEGKELPGCQGRLQNPGDTMFTQVYDYTFSHFPDPEQGEWFGYLTQQGSVALHFKGGPFKGFFHVPRCLHMLLDDLQSQSITLLKEERSFGLMSSWVLRTCGCSAPRSPALPQLTCAFTAPHLRFHSASPVLSPPLTVSFTAPHLRFHRSSPSLSQPLTLSFTAPHPLFHSASPVLSQRLTCTFTAPHPLSQPLTCAFTAPHLHFHRPSPSLSQRLTCAFTAPHPLFQSASPALSQSLTCAFTAPHLRFHSASPALSQPLTCSSLSPPLPYVKILEHEPPTLSQPPTSTQNSTPALFLLHYPLCSGPAPSTCTKS